MCSKYLFYGKRVAVLLLSSTNHQGLLRGGGDAQNVDVDLGHFLGVDCRLKGVKKC